MVQVLDGASAGSAQDTQEERLGEGWCLTLHPSNGKETLATDNSTSSTAAIPILNVASREILVESSSSVVGTGTTNTISNKTRVLSQAVQYWQHISTVVCEASTRRDTYVQAHIKVNKMAIFYESADLHRCYKAAVLTILQPFHLLNTDTATNESQAAKYFTNPQLTFLRHVSVA